MHKYVLAPLAAGVLLALAGTAQAATKQTTFQVSATVNPVCVVSAGAMNFGTYDATAALAATSQIDVRCTNGATYQVALSAGNGTYGTRLLKGNGTNTMAYNLYSSDPSAGSASVWGDGSTSTATVSGTGKGMASANAVPHTVYGQLPNITANQNAPTGTYTDTITVSVNY